MIKPRYAQARVAPAGSVPVEVAGQVARDENGEIIKTGLEAQVRQCLEGIKAALGREGSNRGQMTRVRIFAVNIDDTEVFDVINTAWNDFVEDLCDNQLPARTAVGADCLPLGASVQIEATGFVLGK